MFKALFKRKSRHRDLRFVDSEPNKNHAVDNLRNRVNPADDSFIRVEQGVNSNVDPLQGASFLDCIRQATSQHIVLDDSSLDETIELGLPQISQPKNNAYRFDFDEVVSSDLKQLKGLGVFSDSKIYSALIHSVLSDYHLNIQHFNHPSTFKPQKFKVFDAISAWIVFLSDESDSDFLDLFLDRYVDKPTLFLFSKLNKDASIKTINQFIQQHRLHIPISQTVLQEMDS